MNSFEESIVSLMNKRVETALDAMRKHDATLDEKRRTKLLGDVHMSLAVLKEHLGTMVKLNEAERELKEAAE